MKELVVDDHGFRYHIILSSLPPGPGVNHRRTVSLAVCTLSIPACALHLTSSLWIEHLHPSPFPPSLLPAMSDHPLSLSSQKQEMQEQQQQVPPRKHLGDLEAPGEHDDKVIDGKHGEGHDNASFLDHSNSISISQRLLKFGVEEVGVYPIAEKDRTDASFFKVITLWVAMSVGVVP